MKLSKLLHKISYLNLLGNIDVEVGSIQMDSRKIKNGDLFVAVPGVSVDGHNYIAKSIDLGAAVVVCEKIPEQIMPEVTYLQVKSSVKTLGTLASNFYDKPSDKLKLIGITGTNGKTTTATLLFQLSEELGYAAALISTIKIKIQQKEIPSTHTTPNILEINRILAEAVESGCEYAFMEVSSHGISQDRIAGLKFAGAAFTNITHDHLDYHKTFSNYIEAKKKFFDDLPETAFALTNLDDKNGQIMVQNCKAEIKSFALKTDADFHGKILEHSFGGMLLRFNDTEFWTTLVGKFNASNLLLVYGVALSLGWENTETLTALSQVGNVAGRFQTISTQSGIVVIVDYAHTPDALENVLTTIQQIRTRNEKLLVVVGCGGDRDKTKRPEMAEVATRMADQIIITSDNPRNENPESILEDMEQGIAPQHFNKYLKITDRAQAIKTAFQLAESKDIILIAGKGHETYQEIKGERFDFDDMKIAIETAKTLKK